MQQGLLLLFCAQALSDFASVDIKQIAYLAADDLALRKTKRPSIQRLIIQCTRVFVHAGSHHQVRIPVEEALLWRCPTQQSLGRYSGSLRCHVSTRVVFSRWEHGKSPWDEVLIGDDSPAMLTNSVFCLPELLEALLDSSE
jgi:hypothetical protein